MSHIFISYSKQNIDFARHLRSLLQDQGFSVWMDEKSIEPSDDWWETIETAIKDSDAFVIVMTSASRDSRWVKREILVAENANKPIFPILLEGQVWSRLADIHYEDMSDGVKAKLTPGFVAKLGGGLSPSLANTRFGHAPTKSIVKSRRGLGWMGIGFVAVMVVGIAVLAIFIANRPFDPLTGTATTLFDQNNTATEIALQRTADAQKTINAALLSESDGTVVVIIQLDATGTQLMLQRTVVAQQVKLETLMAENTRIVGTSTLTASPSFTATQAAQATQTPTATGTPGYPCDGEIIITSTAQLNVVKVLPQRSSPPRPPIQQGIAITILDREFNDTKDWYEITYDDGRNQGWIVSDYVLPSTNCP